MGTHHDEERLRPRHRPCTMPRCGPATPLRSMRYSSGSGTASGTASAATSGASPSPTPTAKKITQTVTFSLTKSQYDADPKFKTLVEVGYGITLTIYNKDATPPAWEAGCSVTSTAARRSVQVTFVATTSAAKGAAVLTAANALTGNAATLNTNLALAKTALGADYASITVPTATNVAAASSVDVSSTASGASQLGLSLQRLWCWHSPS